MDTCKEINNCLCCNSDNLRMILDLGKQSPANNYNVTEKFPLRLNVCLDCSHAQLSHAVDPEILFKDYPYMSGVSETMKEYYKQFATSIRDIHGYPPSPETPISVYDIACNDGSQLDAFKELGYKTYGIDPAENLIEATRAKGHEIECGFFPTQTEKTYDIIIAQNVLAHNDNPSDFLIGCREIMHEKSLLVIQTSQANMIKNHQFDTIYHEHISFFNKRSFNHLFNRCGLEIKKQSFIPNIHGGSDLYILTKMPEISVLDYSDFSNRSYQFAKQFKDKIEEIQKINNIICYGAAAKMINLIRFTGISPDYIFDDTPTKKGKTIEGLECLDFENLKFAKQGDVIIPVWNFYDEIKSKVESKFPGKFKFIKYIPEIVIE